MTKRTRKKSISNNSSEHNNNGGSRWLLTYADMITLLLIFFIIMYSISTTSANRFAKFVQTVQKGFSALPYKSSVLPVGSIPERNESQRSDIVNYLNEEINFMKVKEGLITKVKREIENGDIAIINEDRGLNLKINTNILFDKGTAKFTKSAESILSKIALVISDIPNKINIEGHTDNTPVISGFFPSNWELSASRATNVTRYFSEKCNLDPSRFSATGYAQFKPIYKNDPVLGNSKNRRVEIVILLNSDTT